jgi:hypothetical protein
VDAVGATAVGTFFAGTVDAVGVGTVDAGTFFAGAVGVMSVGTTGLGTVGATGVGTVGTTGAGTFFAGTKTGACINSSDKGLIGCRKGVFCIVISTGGFTSDITSLSVLYTLSALPGLFIGDLLMLFLKLSYDLTGLIFYLPYHAIQFSSLIHSNDNSSPHKSCIACIFSRWAT